MCERFGWTLEYWDSLDVSDIYQILAVWDGEHKAQPATPGMK
jgi:hypothetical protein